jgi:hypothetical protein
LTLAKPTGASASGPAGSALDGATVTNGSASNIAGKKARRSDGGIVASAVSKFSQQGKRLPNDVRTGHG